MKVLLLVNPYASAVTSKVNVRIRKTLSESHEVYEKFTTERGHATELAKAAVKDGADAVFVLGGDGTLNEVANGLCGSDTILAPLPGGSTNVFTRSLKLPANASNAAKQLSDLLLNHQAVQIGLGCVNGRRFLFHAGVGFDATVVKLVERKGDLKRWLRHPLYILKTSSAWLRHYDHKQNIFHIHAYDETTGLTETSQVGPMCLALNSNPYTYLGNRPLDVAPDASLDSELVFVGIKSLSAPSILRLVRKTLSGRGKLPEDKAIDYRTNLLQFSLTCETPLAWQLDGDYCGEATRWDFSYEPKSLCLLRPETEPSGD